MSTPNPTFPPGMTSFPPNSQPWRDDSKYQSKVFYCYESDNVANLAAAAAVNLTFNIAGDSDFFWTKFCAFALVRCIDHLQRAATTRCHLVDCQHDHRSSVFLLCGSAAEFRRYRTVSLHSAADYVVGEEEHDSVAIDQCGQ